MIYFQNSRAAGEHTVGPITYIQDFQNVIQPYLQDHRGEPNILVSTLTEVTRETVQKLGIGRIVQVLHSYRYAEALHELDGFTAGGVPTRFITHYRPLAELINAETAHSAVYIPMSIDLLRVADAKAKAHNQGRHENAIIIYGNLYPDKERSYDLLLAGLAKAGVSKIDTLSFGRLNADGPTLTHQQCLQTVARYRYGIGVGRCALEMMAMGLSVMLVGENYGGVIDYSGAFSVHQPCNFNTKGTSRLALTEDVMGEAEYFAREVKRLQANTWQPDLSRLDMQTYVTKYAEAVIWPDEMLCKLTS